ncbi:MAG: hypothetical protein KIT87_15420 [Anaerolineae bacterium]|nr:hypothetical protein [Anaerolineae bacterium]
MIEQWTRDVFAQHLHTPFQVHRPAAPTVTVELVHLTDAPSSPAVESFALLFRGPLSAFLGQGMFRFEHEQMGAADLFIVPVGRDQTGYYYEAVFNRLRG